MNVNIDRAALLATVNRATSVAPSASPMEAMRGVLLLEDPGGNALTVCSTNTEVGLEERIPCQTQGDDAVVVNARLLVGMLERLPGQTINLNRNRGSNQLLLQSGQTSYLISVGERSSFPRMEIPFPEDTVKVAGIPSMAKRTVFAASIEKSKPLLRCVNLMFTRDGLRAAGSNGQCIVTAKGDDKSTGNVSLLIPAQSLDKLASMVTDSDEFRVGTTGTNIVFLKENFTFSARLMEGGYVDTDQLVGSLKNQFTVLTDIGEMHRALRSAASVEADGKVKLNFSGNAMTFTCTGIFGSACADLEVTALRGVPHGEYWYGTRHLLSCLRALSGTVTLGVAQGGILTLSTQDAFYLQTPMRGAAEAKPEPAKKAA